MAGTKFEEAERNDTLWPSALMLGAMLLPFEGSGSTPPGRLTSTDFVEQAVPTGTARQVLRTKMFSTPGVTLGPRFDACVAKAMNGPAVVEHVVDVEPDPEQPSDMLGISLKPLAGVVPSGVETR